jgi:tol-pal system protein YbgF
MSIRIALGTLRLSVPALALAAVVAAAAGCGSGEAARRESDMAALRTQVEELRKANDATAKDLARLSGEMKAMDAQSAFLVGEAKTAAEERARVKAALEQNDEAVRTLRGSLDDALKKLAPPPPAPAAPPKPLVQPLPADATAEKIFARGMASFRNDEHGQAVLEFTEVTEKFPKHPLASSAQYWIGEAYYRQRDFQQALVEFRKVVDDYGQSPQVAEALLKIGLCHRALHDLTRAREAWEQVTKNYPKSDAATQARSLLAALGNPGRRTR